MCPRPQPRPGALGAELTATACVSASGTLLRGRDSWRWTGRLPGPVRMTICLSCAGFDSENSAGDFSEADQRVAGVMRVDTGRSNGIGKVGERPPRENGIQKHRYVVLRV